MAFAVSTKLSLRGVGPKRMIAPKASQGTTNLEYLKSLPGVTAPFPEVFDPANLSATASIRDLRRWRESELIHGRVSMLAAVGFIVQENIQDNRLFFPFAGKITGPAIYHFQQIKQGFWEPLLILIGIAEAYRVTIGWAPPVNSEELNHLREDYNMGDLGFDPLGLKPSEPAALKDMQTKELNNGRLAMIAVAGFVVQELLFQKDVLTMGGFKEAMDQQPLDLTDLRRPIPVEFPDRGLPNVNGVPPLGNINSSPAAPDVVKTIQGFAPSLPSAPDAAANPAPNFQDLPETSALAPGKNGLPDIKALADSLPNRAVPQIPNFLQAGKE